MKKFLFFLCVSTTILVSGQTGQDKKHEQSPTNCGVAQRILDTINELAQDRDIIVIARLGSGESSRNLNKTRLNDASKYLQTAWKRSPQSIILAVGENTKGLGRVDFYVDGKNIYSIFAKKATSIRTYCYNQE